MAFFKLHKGFLWFNWAKGQAVPNVDRMSALLAFDPEVLSEGRHSRAEKLQEHYCRSGSGDVRLLSDGDFVALKYWGNEGTGDNFHLWETHCHLICSSLAALILTCYILSLDLSLVPLIYCHFPFCILILFWHSLSFWYFKPTVFFISTFRTELCCFFRSLYWFNHQTATFYLLNPTERWRIDKINAWNVFWK